VSGKRFDEPEGQLCRRPQSGPCPGLPPMASSSPVADVCLPRYSINTAAPATEARQTKRTAPSAGRF
jgi:hypothetical protein